jgi:hypothetical protein
VQAARTMLIPKVTQVRHIGPSLYAPLVAVSHPDATVHTILAAAALRVAA